MMLIPTSVRRCAMCCLFLLCTVLLPAQVSLILRSGQTITGDIIFENEDVIVLQDSKGARYQYPKQEVAGIAEAKQQKEEKKEAPAKKKKVGIVLQLNAGAMALPALHDNMSDTWRAHAAANLMIGACDMLGKHIFLGGGVGYHSYFTPDKLYAFIPLMVSANLPLMQTPHAPALGLSLGYGISLSQTEQGGLYAGIDAGWRYQMNEKSALFLAASANFQQADIHITENIGQTHYTYSATQCFCTIGLKVGFQF